MNPITDEPLLSAITAFVTATAGLLVALGVHISPDQITALVTFVVAVYAVAVIVRAHVTPNKHLEQ